MTAPKLGVELDLVVTAEQVQAYKPSHRVFSAAEARLGTNKAVWLHVAQGRSYDIKPANELGISNVWVNRPTYQTPPTDNVRAQVTVNSLHELVLLLKN